MCLFFCVGALARLWMLGCTIRTQRPIQPRRAGVRASGAGGMARRGWAASGVASSDELDALVGVLHFSVRHAILDAEVADDARSA